jgi:hypothetical protein
VQTCRELAGETQVFGKTAAAKKKQWNSIEAGIHSVLNVVADTKKRTTRVLTSEQEVSEWIDSNQNSKGRTKSLSVNQRPFVSEALLKKTITARRKLAGMAKGGWIGAGQDIAKAQTGTDRISIGKNFLGYAQKHSGFGGSTRPTSGERATATISNRVRHSAASNVLASAGSTRAINWGLKQTVKWYASALRRQNQKQKT